MVKEADCKSVTLETLLVQVQPASPLSGGGIDTNCGKADAIVGNSRRKWFWHENPVECGHTKRKRCYVRCKSSLAQNIGV